MKCIVCIPARYYSERLPGKALLDIAGQPMIYWVYNNVKKCTWVHEVLVLTDDERIWKACRKFDGNVLMTGRHHRNGTSRMGEVLDRLDGDLIINVQGDEPLVSEGEISALIHAFHTPETQIATLARRITSPVTLFDFNKVKVVFDKNGRALYFSRHPIPAWREKPYREWLRGGHYYLHLGLYAFRRNTLKQLLMLDEGILERSEELEQLRWLEEGYSMQVVEVENTESFGVDTLEDLEKMREVFKVRGIGKH
ncbi:MAG TPA: 3-deoxy-manno-octulosonate cytidylyltransferase [Saprospiraceae bacterium]|nr:3-deoxy-manno-octulosonate cytidylyltransferase [Saprospiraceae bacterium]